MQIIIVIPIDDRVEVLEGIVVIDWYWWEVVPIHTTLLILLFDRYAITIEGILGVRDTMESFYLFFGVLTYSCGFHCYYYWQIYIIQ